MHKSQENLYKNMQTKETNEKEQHLGMAWYKFLIYFALIAGAIINLIYSFGYISGSIYLVQTNGEISSEQVYAYYGTGLQVVDLFYGFFLIALAIFAFVVRHKLARFAYDAVKFIKIYYSTSLGISILYVILVLTIKGQAPSGQIVVYAIYDMIFLLFNIRYFNKRAHLFVNKPISTQTPFPPQAQQEEKASESPIVSSSAVLDNQMNMFCRKCGTKLHEDSAFCHYCGAPIGKSAGPSFINTTPPISHSTVSKQRSKKRTVIIAIIIVLALVLVAGIVALFMNNKSDGDNIDRPATVYNVAVRTISFDDKYSAEYLFASWESGEKTEKSMISLMDEYGAEQGGGKLHIVEKGMWVEPVEKWCFDKNRKKGDCAIIESEFGYTICYFSSKNLDSKDVLIVAVEPDFGLYSWKENGDFYGLHIDIAKEIAKRNGFTAEFVSADWEDLFVGIENGSYNMVFGIEPTIERQEAFVDTPVSFTDVYCDGMASMFNLEAFDLSFDEWSNFKYTIKYMFDDGTMSELIDRYDVSFSGEFWDALNEEKKIDLQRQAVKQQNP